MSKPAKITLANGVLRSATLQSLISIQISIDNNRNKALSNHIYLVFYTANCISMEWKI